MTFVSVRDRAHRAGTTPVRCEHVYTLRAAYRHARDLGMDPFHARQLAIRTESGVWRDVYQAMGR